MNPTFSSFNTEFNSYWWIRFLSTSGLASGVFFRLSFQLRLYFLASVIYFWSLCLLFYTRIHPVCIVDLIWRVAILSQLNLDFSWIHADKQTLASKHWFIQISFKADSGRLVCEFELDRFTTYICPRQLQLIWIYFEVFWSFYIFFVSLLDSSLSHWIEKVCNYSQ